MASQMLGWIVENIFPWLLLLMFAFAVIVIVGGVWHALTNKTPQIVLSASEWECTQWHEERRMTSTMVGKVVVPRWHTVTVPDVYVRRGFVGVPEAGAQGETPT